MDASAGRSLDDFLVEPDNREAVGTLGALAVLAALSSATQMPMGEIAGRISDETRAALPGVRVRISSSEESREVVTDQDGRFVIRDLPMGNYDVAADLAGFRTASGQIALTSSTPKAFLAWPLEVGCLDEVMTIVPWRPREAAPLVDAIVHIRVIGEGSPVFMSFFPYCRGVVVQEYSTEVLGSAMSRNGLSATRRQVFLGAGNARLMPDGEYLALVWPDGNTTDELVMPIASGRVVSPGTRELHGLRIRDALRKLAKWAAEKQR